VNRRKRTMLVILGVAHIIVAIILLPTVFFLGFFSIPTIVPGLIWLVFLGFRLCRGRRAGRTALRLTHSVLAPLAALLVVCMERSVCMLHDVVPSPEAAFLARSDSYPSHRSSCRGAVCRVSVRRPFRCAHEQERNRTISCRQPPKGAA
jgi:hypothetical protein